MPQLTIKKAQHPLASCSLVHTTASFDEAAPNHDVTWQQLERLSRNGKPREATVLADLFARVAIMYKHIYLDDASKQIRLLQFEPASSDANDIVCTVHKFVVGSTPRYAGISYACGPRNPARTITLNGLEFIVTQNSWYVLWRARRRMAAPYFWLDCVCIDLQDVREKTAQVQMMGQIYENAAVVIACVGPHDEESMALLKACGELEMFTPIEPTKDGEAELFLRIRTDGERASRIVQKRQQWVTSLSLETIWHTYNAFQAFLSRPYWDRVWIVQELYVSRQVEFLVGDSSLSWASLMWMSSAMRSSISTGDKSSPLDYRNSKRYRLNRPYHQISRVKFDESEDRRMHQLPEILGNFGLRECYDPRDRIYGLLRLIEWPEHMGPLITDYSQSAFQLACRVVGATRRIFGISGSDDRRFSERQLDASNLFTDTVTLACTGAPGQCK